MRLNSDAFRNLIENINSGTYRAHKDTREYEKLIDSITTRIIDSIDEVNDETLIAFLRNRSFTDYYITDDTIERIVDRGTFGHGYFLKEQLMRTPEIAETRVRGIFNLGTVTLKDVNGQVYRETRLLGELPINNVFPQMTDAQRGNIVNRTEMIQCLDYEYKRQRLVRPRRQEGSWGVRLATSIFAWYFISLLWLYSIAFKAYPGVSEMFFVSTSVIVDIAATLTWVCVILWIIYTIITGCVHSLFYNDFVLLAIVICSIIVWFVATNNLGSPYFPTR